MTGNPLADAKDLAKFLRDIANNSQFGTRLCGCGEAVLVGDRPEDIERECMEWALKLERLIEKAKDKA